ncbi:MAG: DUF707 domain-containing protein [Betaproteobacteria bacterium]
MNRYLVVVRAGDQSLHPQWTRDLATRKWDLVVSYFGSDPQRFRGAGENRIDDRGQKYAGLHALFTREDFWRRYDYIWLPDDDLATEQSVIDDLFETTERLGLELAQPALSWTSHYSHFVTIRRPSFRARMTNFIEIMAPCFHRPFLETCLPTFTENMSGWGMDWLWPRMLPADSRCAVIDDAMVTHTRPVGGPTYDKLRDAGITPQAEAEALCRKFGIPRDIRAHVSAAIDRDGHSLVRTNPDHEAVLRAGLDRDRSAFQEFRKQRRRESSADAAPARVVVHDGHPTTWRQ